MKAATKEIGTKSTQTSKKSTKITEQHIKKRAFEIYMNRGDAPGNEESDWLCAEKELKHSDN